MLVEPQKDEVLLDPIPPKTSVDWSTAISPEPPVGGLDCQSVRDVLPCVALSSK
jgi:hypothetical protein